MFISTSISSSRVLGFGCFSPNSHILSNFSSIYHRPNISSGSSIVSTSSSRSASRTITPPLSPPEEDVLKIFFEDRDVNGDFVSKLCDLLWKRQVVVSVHSPEEEAQPTPDNKAIAEAEYQGGFLKLTSTQEWISGDITAPNNRKAMAKALRDDRERRKKINFLQYEAIKRELLLLSVSIGTACTGYCLIVLSVQAAISYATGVLFSLLYLQLLYRHADNISKETVPQTFMQKKTKKIGIRSEDLKNFFERTIRGSGMVLSSPRLVIPAAIYGLWALSHQPVTHDFFDFQIVPAMFGLFVYKAAALVQVYRDNEGLEIILPEGMGGPSDY